MGKLIPGEEPPPGVPESEVPEDLPPIEEDDVSQNKENRPGLRATLEHWQATIDERIRATLPNFSAFRSLEQEVRRLNERLDALEKRLAEGGGAPESGSGGDAPKDG